MPLERHLAQEWDRQTLDTWLRAHTSGNDEFMAVASAATEAIFGCEPRELSLLYTVFYLAASGQRGEPGHVRAQLQHQGRRAGDALRRRSAHLIPQRVAAQLGIAWS